MPYPQRVAVLTASLLLMPLGGAIPAAADAPAGHVYVQTNDSAGNAVVAFERSADGALTSDETVSTGGLGIAPTGLGSQAALAISADGNHLLAVNAGSDDVSVFDVTDDGLRLADVEPVGDRPVSVAVHGEIVYVLNQGDDTIQGLRITDTGTLTRIPKSTRTLSGSGYERCAACWLVVTSDARFAYTANTATANVSQYEIAGDGSLTPVGSGEAGGTDPGPLDMDLSDGDAFLYVLNSRSGSISAFSVDPDDGSLTSIPGASGFATGWVGLIAV
jgi:6-phosphogluconolactonase (cycloisomerase 2 family)